MKKAVIMAGGFGTRLRPLTMSIPKPMVPIINIPMMEHIVNRLKSFGVSDIVSLLYFQPDKITSYFEDGSKFGINMVYVHAQADYGTAGSVRNAYEHLKERFIIISGDVLTDFDLAKALEFHEKKGAKATICLTRVAQPLAYGIVMTDENGAITRFLEKPSWGEVFSDTINTGIYILEPEVLDLIPYQEDFDFSKDLFPTMLRMGMPLYGYIADGYWRDIGNLDEYLLGQYDALSGKVDLEHDFIKYDGYYGKKNIKVSPSAKFYGNVIIGENVTIGDYSEISDTVIGNNVEIGVGTRLRGVTLWDNVKIGNFAQLSDDVVCFGTVIGESVTVNENVFISENCTIGEDALINSNVKIWPNKHIEHGAILSRSLIQEEKWQRELFTDARITGLANIEISPEFGAKLGTAIGLTLGKNVKFIGSRDPDKVSRIMKRTITAGLLSTGIDVNDLQTTSIPQTRQELRTGRYEGGFHVRRSPRDPDKTDIIIFNKEGRDISIAKTKAIERYFFGEDIKRVHHDSVGNISFPERTNEIYLNRYLQSLDVEAIRSRKFKLLMDYSFGLASTAFPSIMGKMGVEALSLNDFVDASRFHPEPTLDAPETDETGKIMRSLGYELGFRLEAGAEKISLIDERGAWYSPMRLLTIVTKLFLETHRHKEPYKIAVTIVASSIIEEIAKDYNVEVIRIKNTHSAMMEATREPNLLFVGGAYGGYIFTDFLFASDGMFSVGQILEMLAMTDSKISYWDELLPTRYQHHLDVNCPWEYKGTIMRKAMEYSNDMDRQLIEGVKVFTEDGSVLMLPSKERGSFTVLSEGTDYEKAVNLAKKYALKIKRWIEEE
jgi:mannose-1-phosphate guanylyltransferase / phosphomannomutase